MLDSGSSWRWVGLASRSPDLPGLFSALHQSDNEMAPAVYRWRIREIVTLSFRLAFLGFGVIAVYGFTEDVASTARIISGLSAVGGVVTILTAMRPGPVWPDETDRGWSVGASWFWAAMVAGNVIAGSQPYLRVAMLIMLLSPALVFIRSTIDATRPADASQAPSD